MRLNLYGPLARAVLARLVPIDLSAAAFPVSAAARSMLGHMNLLILHAEEGGVHPDDLPLDGGNGGA